MSSIGAIDGNELIINDDVSFNGHILVEDACFNVVEPTSGNLEFLSDVSFYGSIQANEAKFASIDSLTVNSEDIEFTLDIFPRKGGDLTGGQIITHAGFSTALSANGNAVAVGSTGGSTSAGRVQVFEYINNNWQQKGLDLTGGHISAKAGYSTALSANGNVVVVGEPLFNNAQGNTVGRVRVFEYINNSYWQLKGQELVGVYHFGGWWEGISVALSEYGNVVAMGDTYHYTSKPKAGRARVFEYINNNWQQKGLDLSGGEANAELGYSIALSANGNVVAVGEPFIDYDNNIHNVGRVRVFEYISNNWVQRGQDLSGGQVGAEAGVSTALSANGNVVAVGSPGYDYNTDEGRVQVFDYSASSNIWIRRGGADDLSGGQANALAGISTALSADGNVVAVRESSGNFLGRVRVFNYSSVDGWVQRSYDLSGQTNRNNLERIPTALSANGNIVAVGEPLFNNYEGRVSVYEYIDKANLSDIIDSIITG